MVSQNSVIKGFLIISLMFFVIGCAGIQKELALNSTPGGATVKITSDREGVSDFVVGTTPAKYTFVYDQSKRSTPSVYNVEFSLSGYENKVVAVPQDYDRDSIDVVLDREEVKEIPQFFLVVSAERGYELGIRTVRAWVEDIEREGMAASSVVRLRENQSILGLSISTLDNTLYFSLADQVVEEQGRPRTMANIRSVSAAGGGVTQVTSGQWLDANPACSPDGRFVVFSSNRIQPDKPDLFRISAEKTGGIAVIRQTTDGANYEPSMGGKV